MTAKRILAGIALVVLVALVHDWDYRILKFEEQRTVECQK